MTTEARPSIAPLCEWVRHRDGHADARVPLLEKAAALLTGDADGTDGERVELAERLERWRYQLQSERAGDLESEDHRLLDTLDLMANDLAGRQPRPPRRTRELLRDDSLLTEGIVDALPWLDPACSLEQLIQQATALTIQRFGDRSLGDRPGAGREMLLYAPLYLSNHCINHCTYCGFRYPLKIERTHLTLDQARREADILIERGFGHLLLVGGDFPALTTVEYYAAVLSALRQRGVASAVEIAPQSTADYARLVEAGMRGITLYQETYDQRRYAAYHPRGSKAAYDWRFEGLDRAADAGAERLGLGVLLGLADPIEDIQAMMRHAAYLSARHPGTTIAFSLPRIHEAPDGFRPPHQIDDDLFIRLYCVLRLAFPAAQLVLSTRESATLRDRLAAICITQMSAGSCTAPGGYEETSCETAGEQFPVSDHRSAETMSNWLTERGFRVSWNLP